MIKINLLGVAPAPAKATSSGGSPAPKATQIIIFVGALVVCFGIVGILYKVWSNNIADFQKKLSQEKVRQTELLAVKQQNAKYQQRLKDLETRINTIQALQNSRVGPVELMSTLGSVVNRTNDIYLYTLTPTGDHFTLKGQSNTVDSMANFIAFMKNAGPFDDVQLDQFYQDDLHERTAYKFSVTCGFKTASGMSPTAGGPAESAPPVPGKGPSAPSGMAGVPGQVQQNIKRSM
jgi:Tfp pilus assembly protein PilN